MNKYIATYFLAAIFLWGCSSDDGPNLPSYEERVDTALSGLRNDLTTPTQGWRIEYRPTPDAGAFLILMEFTDKEVRIRSDVGANDGVFYDQTIPYRLDAALGLELILETYCVFAFLFEQDQGTFGAEFEFVFKSKEGENLLFESKSDIFTPTQLLFEPAGPNDDDLFSREIAENLDAFSTVAPQALTPEIPQQQIVFEDLGISVFWALDNQKRTVVSQFAGQGTTVEEILENGGVLLTHSSGYGIANESMILETPLQFALGGQSITIDRITLSSFDMNAPNLCPTGPNNGPRYRGSAPGLGDVTMLSTLLSASGQGFQPDVYTVNVAFVFDESGNSISENGIIADLFPNATGFVFLYGVELADPEIPIFSTGLILDNGDIFVREFQPTFTEINRVQIEFTNNYYHSGTPSPGDQQNLMAVTDEIFAGDITYAFEFPISGLSVFRLFNPCNQYEVFLVN